MTHDILLAYPYFNENFKIYNDTIKFQLGAVISQKVKLIAFYGRKRIDAHRSYTVTEKSLLIIVKTLR